MEARAKSKTTRRFAILNILIEHRSCCVCEETELYQECLFLSAQTGGGSHVLISFFPITFPHLQRDNLSFTKSSAQPKMLVLPLTEASLGSHIASRDTLKATDLIDSPYVNMRWSFFESHN